MVTGSIYAWRKLLQEKYVINSATSILTFVIFASSWTLTNSNISKLFSLWIIEILETRIPLKYERRSIPWPIPPIWGRSSCTDRTRWRRNRWPPIVHRRRSILIANHPKKRDFSHQVVTYENTSNWLLCNNFWSVSKKIRWTFNKYSCHAIQKACKLMKTTSTPWQTLTFQLFKQQIWIAVLINPRVINCPILPTNLEN